MDTSSSFCYFLYIVVLLSLSPVCPKHAFSLLQPRCHEDDRSALLKFKENFVIGKCDSADPSSHPKLSSWNTKGDNSSKDCCLWDGIDCNGDTDYIISLDVSGSCLYGSINSTSSLFNLVHLQSLNLARNNFNYSPIPTQLTRLPKLTYLNLSNSQFSGQVPTEISQLSKLSPLDLSSKVDSYSSDNILRLQSSTFRSLIQNLTSIKHLSLNHVDITAKVPENLANLSSLTTLELEDCGLHGEFPTRVFHLPNLQYLDVNFNHQLAGYLPEFHSSNTLKSMNLAGTNFTGMLPPSLGNLTQLKQLDLSSNEFTGPIHSSIGNLTTITMLDLSNNKLQGPIPSSLSQLANLESLLIEGNNLSGIVKLDMFLLLKNLSSLVLSHNSLTVIAETSSNTSIPQLKSLGLNACKLRRFPEFLQNQSKLSLLGLADNFIDILVPKWMYNTSIDSLRFLFLGYSSLTGFDQSPAIFPQYKLKLLQLTQNKLNGSLPIPPPSIDVFEASNNSFTGEISPFICNLSSLSILDLSVNNLIGKLPPCLGNFSISMSVLKLKGNNFQGTIPQTWTNECSLMMIDLSENHFQGQLPSSLAKCTMLEFINMGNNQIKDAFPVWLGNLRELKVLLLRFNRFYGAIRDPHPKTKSSKLQIVDLSHNNFSGNLPSGYLQHWNSMAAINNSNELEYLVELLDGEMLSSYITYSMTIINKGREAEYEKIQKLLKLIDLSSNRFEGEVPELIGNLKGLYLLNLSNNIRSAQIPSSLSNLSNLEALDLSHNKLSGEIPPQLTELNFLGSFSVANNYLTGSIPHGKQFDTFPSSSFEGNVGLCGNPLPKKCESSQDSSPPENQGLGSPFGFDWKVVVMGYGCGLVIGIVAGHTVIECRHDLFMKIFAIRQ